MSTDHRPCPRCRGETIAGRSERGIDVALEVDTLDAEGELRAALAGISTMTHHHGADVITHRSPFQIRHQPAGTRPRTTVHALHDCTERNHP